MTVTLGYIDGVVLIDPETGEPKVFEQEGGLTFRMRQHGGEATTVGRLLVKPGGMCVFAQLGRTGRGLTVHDLEAAKLNGEHQSNLSEDARTAVEQAESRPAAPSRPGKPRRSGPPKPPAAPAPAEPVAS